MEISDKRKQYIKDYKRENIKRIPLDVPIAKYSEWKAAADNAGEKVNEYIKKSVDERIKRQAKKRK